jgi:hypothetical protein
MTIPFKRQTIQATIVWMGSTSRIQPVVTEFGDTAKAQRPDRQQLHEVLEHLDLTLADGDQYQDDEPHPPEHVIEQARRIVQAMADLGIRSFPKTYVATYYGEIDLTWKTVRNLMRVIIKPNGEIHLYHQANYRESGRGESRQITLADVQSIADRMNWLFQP